MNILIVDDDPAELEKQSELIRTLCPDAEFTVCGGGIEALAKAREKRVDVAFLDTDMPELDGLDLGQYLKELNPMVNIVFLSEVKKHAFAALKLHASGYVMKPLTKKKADYELTELRYSEALKKQKRVFAQTFGNFELFIDGKPAVFKYNRTKEIVALLVNNRGAQTTNGEIIAALWEDGGDPEKKMSYLRNLRQDLQNTLKDLKLESIIVKQRGSMAISVEDIDCDLYDWMEKKSASRFDYIGEYMNQYSWAEFVHAELDEIYYDMQG